MLIFLNKYTQSNQHFPPPQCAIKLCFFLQISFCMMVYPSLIITYVGEMAYLIRNPRDIGSSFYKSIPNGVYWPMFGIATLASIVASQPLISKRFSIINTPWWLLPTSGNCSYLTK
jgi:hypothetical protein